LYWLTTNLWTMGQQFYTIRRMPAPGSLAEKALAARRLKSGKEHKKFSIPGLTQDDESEGTQDTQDTPAIEAKPTSGQRQQPKRNKKRAKPQAQGSGKPETTPPGPKPAGGKPAGAKPAGGKPPGAKPPGSGTNGSGGDVT
ncbi:MAG TPA: hypothetical protein VES02_09400, partial [Dermatophilaceae bacterium]|nr:hypothetical protein [Dermatophilaceae bacterium]